MYIANILDFIFFFWIFHLLLLLPPISFFPLSAFPLLLTSLLLLAYQSLLSTKPVRLTGVSAP